MILLLPFFLIVIFLEYRVSKRESLGVYHAGEILSNVLNGLGQQIIGVFWFAILIAVHQKVFHTYHAIEWDPKSPAMWITMLIVTDFIWYWAHRASHRINLFIASHVTHHHAEEFNHASALRQSWTSRIFIYVFFIPLALLGFEAKWILISQVISGAIQFITHNGIHKKRLPMIDWLFVTPRFHFAHHGIHSPYLDKNYGGVFIIWDRMFGTFQDIDEKVPVVIGSGQRFDWLSPFESNFIYYKQMAFVMKRREGLIAKIKVPFQTPEVMEADLSRFGFTHATAPAKIQPMNREKILKIVLMILLCLGGIVLLQNGVESWLGKSAVSLILFFGIYQIGRMCFEKEEAHALH